MPSTLGGDQRARRWGAISKIASPWKSMLHVKGGGNREGSGTVMSNTKCQELKIRVEECRVVTTLNIIKHEISYLV
jgi:hypothetical protein